MVHHFNTAEEHLFHSLKYASPSPSQGGAWSPGPWFTFTLLVPPPPSRQPWFLFHHLINYSAIVSEKKAACLIKINDLEIPTPPCVMTWNLANILIGSNNIDCLLLASPIISPPLLATLLWNGTSSTNCLLLSEACSFTVGLLIWTNLKMSGCINTQGKICFIKAPALKIICYSQNALPHLKV